MTMYAHLPGSGPADKKCRDCAFFDKEPLRQGKIHLPNGYCGKARQMIGGQVERISSATEACKYFEACPDVA